MANAPTDDAIYILASGPTQAHELFGLYQISSDENAIRMIRDGVVNPTEEEARTHQVRAGRGEIFRVDFKITQCST